MPKTEPEKNFFSKNKVGFSICLSYKFCRYFAWFLLGKYHQTNRCLHSNLAPQVLTKQPLNYGCWKTRESDGSYYESGKWPNPLIWQNLLYLAQVGNRKQSSDWQPHCHNVWRVFHTWKNFSKSWLELKVQQLLDEFTPMPYFGQRQK